MNEPPLPPGLNIQVKTNNNNATKPVYDNDDIVDYSDTASDTSSLPPGLVTPRGFVRRLSSIYNTTTTPPKIQPDLLRYDLYFKVTHFVLLVQFH